MLNGKNQVFGVARKMNRDNIKSDYCTSNAAAAFQDLIKNINARYILLSYNNMETKGNDRSNARITDEDIMRVLKAKGKSKFSPSNINLLQQENLTFKEMRNACFYVFVKIIHTSIWFNPL